MMQEIQFWREALADCSVYVGGKKCTLTSLREIPLINDQTTFAVDTRGMTANQIYVALPGANVDGHDFLDKAISAGAVALIIKDSEWGRLEKIVKNNESLFSRQGIVFGVSDTLAALQSLARVWRKRFTIPVVGVTGSIGKTTTKEMIQAILYAANIPACVSYKNQNSFVGLYLNILRMRPEHKVAVFEVGISRKGEMLQKVDVLCPTHGVVTTVAHSHMQDLGALSEIAKEKRNLFFRFKDDQVGIIFGDLPLLSEAAYAHPVVRFGFKFKNQVQARRVQTCFAQDNTPYAKFILSVYKQKHLVMLKTHHRGSVHNALAASAVAHALGIEMEYIVAGLNNYNGFEQRFEKRLLRHGHGELISDCYNANPESMRAAIIAVHEMKAVGQKIAVIGDMLELGKKELFWHRQVGRVFSRALSFDMVVLVGPRSKVMEKAMPVTIKKIWAADWKDASEKLHSFLEHKTSLVLVKASHGVGLENLVKALTV